MITRQSQAKLLFVKVERNLLRVKASITRQLKQKYGNVRVYVE
jgi:hypothetical protein